MQKHWLKKLFIGLGLAAFLVLGFFMVAFLGNPVSKFLAGQTAKKHLAETYADTDYEVDRVFYNFKDGDYHAQIVSPSSQDTHFNLQMTWTGALRRDNYEDQVASGWNTAMRLDDAYRKLVDTVLDDPAFPFESDIDFGSFEFCPRAYLDDPDVPPYALVQEDLILDHEYDIYELGRKAGKVTLYVCDDEISIDRAAQVLLEVRDAFDRAGVPFYAIDFVLMAPKAEDGIWSDEQIGVQDFLYSDIYEEGLVDRLGQAYADLQAYYESQDKLAWDARPMVWLDGQLYYYVGDKTRSMEEEQVFDGKIESQVASSEIPSKEKQSNFGMGYPFIVSDDGVELEVYLEGDQWMVFTTEIK